MAELMFQNANGPSTTTLTKQLLTGDDHFIMNSSHRSYMFLFNNTQDSKEVNLIGEDCPVEVMVEGCGEAKFYEVNVVVSGNSFEVLVMSHFHKLLTGEVRVTGDKDILCSLLML